MPGPHKRVTLQKTSVYIHCSKSMKLHENKDFSVYRLASSVSLEFNHQRSNSPGSMRVGGLHSATLLNEPGIMQDVSLSPEKD